MSTRPRNAPRDTEWAPQSTVSTDIRQPTDLAFPYQKHSLAQNHTRPGGTLWTMLAFLLVGKAWATPFWTEISVSLTLQAITQLMIPLSLKLRTISTSIYEGA
ncbi:hypothetical protein BN1723_020006 [Verticillium longisporum]|uniref:Uncharacterized protein n=1 Tax=Verticillium longisporum TaxID=100787 RepID=A0A0G4NJ04_VERLO|nr:hypothetical protein BN1723_020006 [Verticillium longisporum]